MFPFSSCVCQDYSNWLIISNNSNDFLSVDSNLKLSKDHGVEIQEKCLSIVFPKSENNSEFTIPDVTKASTEAPTNKSNITGDQLTILSPITDIFSGNYYDYSFANQDHDQRSQLTDDDIRLLNQVNQMSDKKRLIRIQRSKKYNKRRLSINCYQNIRICNPDRFGLVDLSNWNLTQKYLNKYLNSWDFNIFRLNRFTGGKSTLVELGIEIFQHHNLINHFRFDYDSLKKFLYSVQSVYHSFNPYHNALHSADVAQSMHCFLSDKKIKSISNPIDVLGCIIAALCHDADHPGLNQLYLEKINHFFVTLYNHSSVLENHHIRVTMSLLHQSTLLNFLSADDWRIIFPIMCNLILATDITHQKSYLNRFINLYHERKSSKLSTVKYSVEEKTLIYQMALKCSDISNPCRCWPVSLGWASLVCEEFFLQGDVEKTLGLTVMSIHDRCMSTKADIQLGFIRFIVRPLITQWNCFLKSDLSLTLVNQVDHNLTNWESFKQRFSAISAKTLQSPLIKIDTSPPLISGLATLTEETTLVSPCITRPHNNYQRRFSLPDTAINKTIGNHLQSQDNLCTTMITFPRVTPVSGGSGACRRGSLPQHPKPTSLAIPDLSRRRGSLPLNVRAFPIPTAWEECSVVKNRGGMGLSKSSQPMATNERLQGRRGSAPLIGYPRCGQDWSLATGNTTTSAMIRGCSRDQMLLEVYWMTASSSVSSTNSVHCASNSNIQLLSSVPHSSSSSSSRNDSGTGTVTIR